MEPVPYAESVSLTHKALQAEITDLRTEVRRLNRVGQGAAEELLMYFRADTPNEKALLEALLRREHECKCTGLTWCVGCQVNVLGDEVRRLREIRQSQAEIIVHLKSQFPEKPDAG